jgi:hypothetical protein
MVDDRFSQTRRFSLRGFGLRGFGLRGAAGKVVHAEMEGNFIMRWPHQSGPSVIVTPC